MNRKQLSSVLLLLGVLVVLPGCREGYIPPQTAVNTIDLQKVELSQTGIIRKSGQ